MYLEHIFLLLCLQSSLYILDTNPFLRLVLFLVYGLPFHFSNRVFYRKEKTFNFDEAKFIDFVFFLDLTLDVRPKTFTSSCLFFSN